MAGCRNNLFRGDNAIALSSNHNKLKAIEKGIKVPSKALEIKMDKLYNVPITFIWKYAI